jgi:hypothetical protein
MSGELEVTRGRRWARHGGNALVALSMLTVPGSCLVLYALIAPQVAASLGVFALVCATLWLLNTWNSRRLNERWLHRRLRIQLARFLASEGLDRLDRADPRRVERERVFWQDNQHKALVALRARFVVEPLRLDLLDAARICTWENRELVGGGLALSAVTILVGALAGLASGPRGLAEGATFGCAVSVAFMTLIMCALAAEAWSMRSASRKARRAFEQDSRRIVTMAELAGGLSLAEHIHDDALIGALSGDGAQDRELDQVEP